MSRGNASIARLLRDEESQLLRKRILKNKSASSLGPEQEEIFEELAESNNKYMERIASLSKFTEKSKTATKKMSHKVIWFREQSNLGSSVNQIQNEITDLLSSLLIHSPGDASVTDLIDEMNALYDSRNANSKLLLSQWQDIDAMKKDILKNVDKHRQQQQSQSQSASFDSGGSNNSNAAGDINASYSNSNDVSTAVDNVRCSIPEACKKSVAVFADILVKLREGIMYQTIAIHSVENDLLRDVLKDRNMIFHMLHQEVLSDQNETLLHEFQIQDTDDTETDIFMQEWMSKFPSMDAEFKSHIEELQRERGDICDRHQVDVNDINGGWAQERHDIFSKVYRRASNEGMARKLLIETLLAELPDKTKQNILDHEEWYRTVKSINLRKSELTNEYKTKRSAMVNQFKEELAAFRAQRRVFNAADELLKDRETERQELHKILEKMRMDRAALLEEELNEKNRMKQVEDAKILEIHERIKAEQDIQRKQVEKYKQIKYEALQKKLQDERDQDALRLQQLREDIEQNRENVTERQRKLDEKEQLKRKKELEMEIREVKRLEWLAKLAEDVPYFDAIQNAQSMLDHITAAVENQKFVKIDYTRGFFPVNGFTDNRIIKDARFRLANALRDAGVIHSDAARRAIQQFHPRPHLAIHGIL